VAMFGAQIARIQKYSVVAQQNIKWLYNRFQTVMSRQKLILRLSSGQKKKNT
jgi:hypothetical protein